MHDAAGGARLCVARHRGARVRHRRARHVQCERLRQRRCVRHRDRRRAHRLHRAPPRWGGGDPRRRGVRVRISRLGVQEGPARSCGGERAPARQPRRSRARSRTHRRSPGPAQGISALRGAQPRQRLQESARGQGRPAHRGGGTQGAQERGRADFAEARQLHRQRRSRDVCRRARAGRCRTRHGARGVRSRSRARDHRARAGAERWSMTDRLRVGVFFGSRSVEHEVSIITAQQVMAGMTSTSLVPVPVYIAKSGAWYTGDLLLQLDRYKDIDRLVAASTRVTMRPDPGSEGELLEVDGRRGLLRGSPRAVTRFDVAMPLVHGSNGEDGTLQGLFELAGVAYCGCDVAAAAVSMDKRLCRTALRGAGLPVLDDVAVARVRWLTEPDGVIDELEHSPGYPMYGKPRRPGRHDPSCLAEPAQEAIIEINCAVLGQGDDVQVSVCEQPVSTGTLSYADKYLSGAKAKGSAPARAMGMKSARRLIPAPISASLTTRIQDAAMSAFRAIGATGVTRIHFLVSTERDAFVINEMNTLPGSLSFYLWEASGIGFGTLIGRLVDMALTRHREQLATTSSIDTWLLTGRPG